MDKTPEKKIDPKSSGGKPCQKCCVYYLIPILCSLLLFFLLVDFTELHPETLTTFHEQCSLYNFTSEEYTVTTPDGYILTLYRIPNEGPPVLMLHGLINSANTLVINQCGKSPAFILAENGYDVWLSNNRGNHLSRNHTHLNSSQSEYWDWSFIEMFYYDFPTFVKFVYAHSNNSKIAVIGHSLGGIIIANSLALLSEELDQYISIGLLMGSPGGVVHTNSYYIKLISSNYFLFFAKLLGFNVFGDWTDNPFYAKLSKSFPRISELIASDISSIDINGGNYEDIAILTHKAKGGVSLKSLEYMHQYIKNELVYPKVFDYGPAENLRRYGQEDPPQIFFNKIKTKIAIFNGKYDKLFTKNNSLAFKESFAERKFQNKLLTVNFVKMMKWLIRRKGFMNISTLNLA